MPRVKQAKTVQVPLDDELGTRLDAARAGRKRRVGHNVPRYAIARDALDAGLDVLVQREREMSGQSAA